MSVDAKKFTAKIFLFLALLVVVLYLLNDLYVDFVLSNKISVKKEKQLRSYFPSVKILFMGDSHIEHGLDPQYIENSFNWAIGGETYKYTLIKLNYALSRDNNIETIVLPIDPNSFYKEDKKCDDVWFWAHFFQYDEALDCSEDKVRFYTNKYLPIIGNGQLIADMLLQKKRANLIRGYNPRNKTIDSSRIEKNVKSRSQFSKKNKFNNELFDSFIESVKSANAHNKKIILIKSPFTEQYVAELKKNINFDQYYEKIFSSIPSDIEYTVADYQNVFSDLDLFSDADHLNIEGAKILSQEFSDFLNKLSVN